MLLYANVTGMRGYSCMLMSGVCVGMVMRGCVYGREALAPQEKGLTVKASSK